MKKSLFFAAMAAFALSVASCGNSQKSDNLQDEPATLSVDEVLANPDSLMGDTIVVEGVCSHLCAHGGRKAFVAGSADSLMLRCEAFPLMGEPFPQSVIHQPIQVKGLLREQRVDEAAIAEMEAKFLEQMAYITRNQGEDAAEAASQKPSGCDTERAAQGQKELTTFNERMADYRARIAERNEKEGKPYLSFYYLDAVSFTTLDE